MDDTYLGTHIDGWTLEPQSYMQVQPPHGLHRRRLEVACVWWEGNSISVV